MSAERPGISGCIRSGDEILEASVLGTRHLGSLNCNERKPHTSGQYILPMVFNKLFELQGAFGASVQSERSRDCRDMAWWPANEPIPLRSCSAEPSPFCESSGASKGLPRHRNCTRGSLDRSAGVTRHRSS
jgi:hypothetical protein